MEKQDYQNKAVQHAEMSIKEYADLRGVTVGAVYDGINNERNQPGLVEVKLIGTHKILVVDKSKV
jgi:ABC-type amino acid transport substrate-binding protein